VAPPRTRISATLSRGGWAHGRRQLRQGDFLAPSPSANLVGHGKGDPLSPHTRCLHGRSTTTAPSCPPGTPDGVSVHVGDDYHDLTGLLRVSHRRRARTPALIGAALVLKGLALQNRPLPQRLPRSAPSPSSSPPPGLCFAGSWVERTALLAAACVLARSFLGLVIIREDQVGVVIKKFAASQPARRPIHRAQR